MKGVRFNKIQAIKQAVQRTGTHGMSMGFRLFLFLIVLVITIILGVIAILFITGTFTAGLSESQKLVENELLHASQEISEQYGALSIHAIEFAKELSRSIEENAESQGINLSELQDHPEALEDIIAAEFDRTLFILEKAKTSGAFFILNATVNPALDKAEFSRAGLYIKNMEPNILSASSPNYIVFRGSPIISRKNNLSLHTQWSMEFDVSEAPYYHHPIEAARSNKQMELSRLYHWSEPVRLPNASEEVMLCSVPLIDSQDNVFGVCGLDISTMFFKLSNMPSNRTYTRLFCMLSPIDGDTIKLNQSMFAGGFSARNSIRGRTLKISEEKGFFTSYTEENQPRLLGFHKPVRLYPKGSAFADEQWIVAIMIPKEDVVASITRLNLLLIGGLMILVLVGIIGSLVLSRKYLQPITQGLDIIKSTDLSTASKTRIPELDNLIEYLALHNRELYEKARQENLSLAILDEFLGNTKKLSPAERAVFDLYLDGHTAKEISELLHLSINTIKTHSKHIYAKLNITSREELLLYDNLLKEIGRQIE